MSECSWCPVAGDGQVAQGALCRDAKPGKQQVLSTSSPAKGALGLGTAAAAWVPLGQSH